MVCVYSIIGVGTIWNLCLVIGQITTEGGNKWVPPPRPPPFPPLYGSLSPAITLLSVSAAAIEVHLHFVGRSCSYARLCVRVVWNI